MNRTVTFSETSPLVRQISDQSEARKENNQTPTEHILAKESYKEELAELKEKRKEEKRKEKLKQTLKKSIEIDPRAEAREAMRIQELNKLYEKSIKANSSKKPITSIKLGERTKDSNCIPGQSCSIMGGKKRKTRRTRARKTRKTRRTRRTRK
jgi:hypothetical protein